MALSAAFAQIVSVDRGRLPRDTVLNREQPAEMRPTVRDVTPRAFDPAATPPDFRSASPAASVAETAPLPRTSAAPTAAPLPPAAPVGLHPPRPPVVVLEPNEGLDPRVARTRERLIEAARSGNLDRLQAVFQMAETMPVFTRRDERDPIAFWRQASGDGQGHEILAILLNILELPPAHKSQGGVQEMYVWPYLAEVQLDRLNASQSVDLYRLMTAQDVRDMRTLGSWVFWRLGIGPDGTLLFFIAGE